MTPAKTSPPFLTGALLALATTVALGAAPFQLLHEFVRPGSNPVAPPTLHSDGNLYGTTPTGGTHGLGTVYRISPTGDVSTLHSFAAGSGHSPVSNLVETPDGNLYGTTGQGGASNFGTVFKITTTGTLTTLVELTGTAGDHPGAVPAGLALHSDGNLYGLTAAGGATGLGTAFRLTVSGTFSTIANFSNPGGANPVGALTSSGGNLFGTTTNGGSNGGGTAFELTPTGTLTTLHHFGTATGTNPAAGLTPHPDGNLYGTTEFGGSSGFGTAFRLTTTGSLTVLHHFDDPTGSQPSGHLAVGSGGTLYGVTNAGGTEGWGTVFSLTTTGTHSLLASFSGESGTLPGAAPRAGLSPALAGGFIGVTSAGGPGNLGTLFALDTPSVFPLANFSPDLGWAPAGPPVATGPDSFLFPLASGGGAGGGTLATIDTSGTTTLAASLGDSSGSRPDGKLLEAGGAYYGITTTGGASGRGTSFRFFPETGQLESFVDHASSLAAAAGGGYIRGSDGALYALGREGGTSGRGTFYKVGTNGARLRLASFTGTAGAAKGTAPHGPVALGPDAAFYGVTERGGSSDTGTIFRLSALGTFSTLAEFTTTGPRLPRGGLTLAADGKIYGTTSAGGTHDAGTIISITPGTPGFAVVAEFTGPGGTNPGTAPVGSLTTTDDGQLVGLTASGGTHDAGTAFAYQPGGDLSTLVELSGESGDTPGRGTALDDRGLEIHGGLTPTGDGRLIAVTPAGGTFGGGTAFLLSPAAETPLDAWKRTELGDTSIPSDADTDFDGIPLLLEYALLLSPTSPDPDSLPQPQLIETGGNLHPTITLTRDPSRSDITITVESSQSLTTDSWLPIATSTAGAPFSGTATVAGDTDTPGLKTVTITDPSPTTTARKRFLRIHVATTTP